MLAIWWAAGLPLTHLSLCSAISRFFVRKQTLQSDPGARSKNRRLFAVPEGAMAPRPHPAKALAGIKWLMVERVV